MKTLNFNAILSTSNVSFTEFKNTVEDIGEEYGWWICVINERGISVLNNSESTKCAVALACKRLNLPDLSMSTGWHNR
jgi:hypothetical protein